MQLQLLKLTSRLSLLALSGGLLILDQLTKFIARTELQLWQIKPFCGHWNWTLIYNEGAAFSLLANQNGWQKYFFATIALVVALGLIYYILAKPCTLISGLGFSLILSGASGNLVDRVLAGKVTDFIDWYIGNYHWPAFNLADSLISIGIALLLLENFFINRSGA
jgi:signal peptidase II